MRTRLLRAWLREGNRGLRSGQRPARDLAGEPVPESQKSQPGTPHAAPPDPGFSQQTAPPGKAREPARAGPPQREPDGGCVSTRGQAKTRKREELVGKRVSFVPSPSSARGGLQLRGIQGRVGGRAQP